MGLTHTLSGGIRVWHATLYMLVVGRPVPLLVLSRPIVTGIGRPGGEVIRRWIGVGYYFLITIVGPVERLQYVTGEHVERRYLTRHHTHG